MTMKEKYLKHVSAWETMDHEPLGSVFKNQEDRYVEPFHIYGPIWYVGDTWVCVHLIDTGDGLLLIDCGNSGATAMLIHAIWKAGFNPADVKWIILSHGHLDHIGGAEFFRKMFGTELYMGKPDCDMFRERPELALLQDTGNPADQIFDVDHEIEEGEVLKFGNIEIEFRLVPGHTDGCIAMFFDVKEDGDSKRVGYYGGFGFNTLTKEYLTEIGDTEFRQREIYLESIEKVKNEKVELFLGNHCENNRTLEKMKELQEGSCEGNPFIDETEWKSYLERKEKELKEFMASE